MSGIRDGNVAALLKLGARVAQLADSRIRDGNVAALLKPVLCLLPAIEKAEHPRRKRRGPIEANLYTF